eukprot:TRINITY_DN16479_c0_g1_i1.p1 TRINITY_DN16479_c0_g1~~TRINITY_DN16479_c0_g1_i1.p1  ORF type:complete len:290 (-),score=46.50 TRINITY_DN16479_c0_g1_i1:494-1363(-)
MAAKYENAAEGARNNALSQSHLPENSEDQLHLGIRMIQNAFNSKVSSLEQELRGLKLSFDEQKSMAAAIQKKNSGLEVELVDSHRRAQQLGEENKELFKTVQQLRRQLQRLEGLKKKVMDSIQSHHDDQSTCDYEGGPHRDEFLRGALPMTMAAIQGESVNTFNSQTSRPASRPTSPPVRMPPGSASQLSGSMGDSGQQFRGEMLAAATNAPTGEEQGGAGQIDGKQFFRQARASLSFEGFNEFLTNIKALNNNQQTREQTLEEARRIFGSELRHLYDEFERLLNRHAM